MIIDAIKKSFKKIKSHSKRTYRIEVGLDKDFADSLNRLKTKYGKEFEKINNLNAEKLNFTEFIDNFVDSDNVANASIDPSANVAHKDVVSLIHEMSKPHQKLLALNKLYYEIKKKYGREEADNWLESEWNKTLYMHDAHTSTFFSYCFAYDLKDVAEKGLFFIDNFNAQPPKHLESFVDFVKEHCSYCCNRSAGAVAYPNLIPYMWYFWHKDVESGYYTKTPEIYAKQQIQRLIYSLNQPWVRGGIQSAFTNANFFDHPYFEAIFGGSEFPDGTFMIDYEEEIIEFQKLFLTMMKEIRHANMMTYPVSTISLLTDENGNFADEEFARWACEHNREWNDSNWFIDSSVTSLSSCCRLRNDVKELGYFNSIGGAALKVGSIKVSTINLARLAYDNNTEESYLEALSKVVLLDLRALDCQRGIIRRNVEKGLLPNFAHNLIDFDHSYSSIGIMGIYETMNYFGYTYEDDFGNVYYKDEAFEFGRKIFDTIHRIKDDFTKDKDYSVNLEAVPGESCGVKFAQADSILYPDKVNTNLPLMANQWIGLATKATIQERVKIAALFSEYCSGGDILHINIEAPFDSFEKAWDMLQYVAHRGVKYFAFTGRISACSHNHAFYGNVCPECGEPKATDYSRIVGFFVPVKTYSKERKEEWGMREWLPLNKITP